MRESMDYLFGYGNLGHMVDKLPKFVDRELNKDIVVPNYFKTNNIEPEYPNALKNYNIYCNMYENSQSREWVKYRAHMAIDII